MAYKKRTRYSMSHQVSGGGRMGRLVCTMSQEVAPGDTWSGKVGLLVRMAALDRAILQDIYVDQFMFYVPHRLVWADWEDFIADGPQSPPNYIPPATVLSPGESIKHLWYNESRAAVPGAIIYSALRLYAYNLIWNEYFRDEQHAPLDPTYGSANQGETDYGANVSAKRAYWSNLQEELEHGDAHTIDVSGSTVEATEILAAIAKQKIAMKRATYGTRYVDILKSYGINVNYQMLQRPELVGMASGAINVTDVVSTSEDSTGGGENPALGDLAGHGIGGSRMRIRRKSFPEHGTLMALLVVRPNYVDSSYNDWFDSPRTYQSFYDPGLVPLPAQEVLATDVQPSWNFSGSGAQVQGYQPWGQWYRRAMSRNQIGFKDWVAEHLREPADDEITASIDLKMTRSSNYNPIFTNNEPVHYQFSSLNKMRAIRSIPRSNMALVTGMAG